MSEDITLNPEGTSNGILEMQRQMTGQDDDLDMVSEQQMQMYAASGIKCPE